MFGVMEPQIRFCTSAAGTRIAYATMGQGPLLLTTPSSWESMKFVLSEVGGPFYELLARRFRIVRYDRSGTGMSDRGRQDFGIEADLKDLEGVADAVGETFALMGSFHLGPASIMYAARHPDRVSRLILYDTYAAGPDLTRDEVRSSLISMVRSHWGMGSRMLADVTTPGASGDVVERVAKDERESTSGETVARLLEEAYATDVTDLLPRIPMPTLVIHRRGDRAVPARMGRELAAALPNARLVLLDGFVHWPWFEDSEGLVQTIRGFLSEGEPEPEYCPTSGTAVILFADIVDSTGLTERLGDEAFRGKARELDRSLRAMIREAEGTPVEGKLLGDGVLAVFTSARQAIEAALRCGAAGENAALPLHLGLHAGDVIREGDNVHGGAVNIAARIAAQSPPGEVLVSQTVRDLARTSAVVSFEDRGEHELKGVAEPIRVFAVRHQAGGPP
jgi:class 3 adenylate cyclase/pimeloyl-ACP methyl ester carboxylesterase